MLPDALSPSALRQRSTELLHTAARALTRYAEHLSSTTSAAPAVIVCEASTADPFPHLQCPRCGTQDQIVEVDLCVRQNRIELSAGIDNSDLYAQVHETDSDFQTDHYACSACLQHVEIPTDVVELTWS